jgi:hypothetical protein
MFGVKHSFGMWVVCTHNHAFHVQQYGYKGSLAYIYTYFLMFFVYIFFFQFSNVAAIEEECSIK